jgi:wyosine [tRNA(Phe)-imidazoG37] synthetase (radical SAM superfamily)
MSEIAPDSPIRDHRRQWRQCRYVYPVVSRRSAGLSIGVNLNPNKNCTFACMYCQVDRSSPAPAAPPLDLPLLRQELHAVLAEAVDGRIWQEPRLAGTPAMMRRLNDVAFSGDGEPTCLPQFDQAVAVAADVRRELVLAALKLVVITNASQLHCPQVRRALPILAANNGEIWAKLDAGTERMFERVNRPYPRVSLQRILDNILAVSRLMPVVIQSLFFRIDGAAPPPSEIDAYCGVLREMIAGGGKIKLVQVHTIARAPASPQAAALSDVELDMITECVRAAVAPVPVETYYG